MKNSKLFIVSLFAALISLQVTAQLKVMPLGAVSIGGNFNPAPSTTLHVLGNAIFSTSPFPSYAFAPMIRATNNLSTALNPEYTWSLDDKTGIFHPGAWQIGFTNGG